MSVSASAISGRISSGFSASGVGGFPNIASNDTYGAIAYQFILGGAMPIPQVRGLAFTAEYRFFGVGSRKYNVSAQAAPGTPVTFVTATLGNDFNHAVMIGLRYNFGQPPPPPPPAPAAAPAPAPTRSYLVFFDWDKAALTDRARQIIRKSPIIRHASSTRGSRLTATPIPPARRRTTKACRSVVPRP